jgi:hypothetical protein
VPALVADSSSSIAIKRVSGTTLIISTRSIVKYSVYRYNNR